MGEKLVEDFSSNKRMFWREVKKTRKGMEVKEECVNNGLGCAFSNGREVCDRWKEYFDGLLNVSESWRGEIPAKPEMNVSNILFHYYLQAGDCLDVSQLVLFLQGPTLQLGDQQICPLA